jgi:translocation and assembly module TamB
MNWKRTAGWTASIVGILIVVVLVGGYFVLRSGAFHRYVIRQVVARAEKATGGKAEVRSLDFHVGSLSADLTGFVLRGTEGHGQPPLLQVQRITVGLRIFSLLHKQFGLSELIVDHPVVHLYVDREGHSNVPQPAPAKPGGSSFNLFNFTIAHAELNNGEIFVNDKKSAVDADVYNLNANVDYNSLLSKYHGSLGYNDGRVRYAGYAPLTNSLDVKFSATPSEASVSPLQFAVGSSRITVNARLHNYGEPMVDGSYSVLLHTQDFSRMLATSAEASGDISLSGEIQYRRNPRIPMIRAVTLDARLQSPELIVRSPQANIKARSLRGEFELADGNLKGRAVGVDLLDGIVTATFDIRNLDGTPEGNFQAAMQRISLQAAKESLWTASARQVPVSGTLEGSVSGSWVGSVKNLQARSDMTVRGKIGASRGKQPAPLNADLHLSYDGRHEALTLRDTRFVTAGTTVTAQGTIGANASLQIQAQTDDIGRLMILAKAFGSSGSELGEVSGSAKLSASVQGSVKVPQISAQLTAANLHVNGTAWKSLHVAAKASPSQIVVQNVSLVGAKQGQVTFSGGVDLQHWSYVPSAPIRAKASLKQIRIAELEKLAGKSYPISGMLAADLSFHGSQLDPVGNGALHLTDAKIAGQPMQNATVQFNASQGTIHSTLSVATPAGNASGTVAFTPKTKSYQFELSAPEITLEKIEAVQAKIFDASGKFAIQGSGSGTLANPQLSATIKAPQLQFEETSIADINAQLEVSNHVANVSLTTNVAQASVQAKGQMNLSGDYYATANLDTSVVPLTPVLAAYVSGLPAGLQATTEIHASLKGPLKDPARVEAHVTIPSLKANYQKLEISNAGPIRINYANSVAVIEPAEMRGTGTSLQFQGRIPVRDKNAMRISAKGSVNLGLLSMFSPDLTSSGNIALDLQTTGGASGVEGKIRIQNASFSTLTSPVAIEKLSGTLDVRKGRIQISDLSGQMGGGQISAGGFVTYRPQLQLNLALQAKSVRLLYPEGLRTVLDGNVNFTGSSAAAVLQGRVLIDSISFTPEFDLASFANQLSGNTAPPSGENFADRVKLSISVQTAGQFAATSSQVSLEGQANLRVIGTASDPVIIGRADISSGEVFFMKKRYELQRGIVNFVNPSRTEPVLNMLISTTVEQYNLSVTLMGPLDRLRTSYVSDPPLSPVDIINLIARGQTTEESTPGNFGADSILASGIASQLSSSLGKLAGFSSIQIDPLLQSNGQSPTARVIVQQRVSRNLLFTFSTDVTDPQSEIVQGEYQVNKRWSVSATRDENGGIGVDARYHTNF